ncbi:MAG: Uma2 family endonuclease [Chloroflexota bacterium]|nr:MAG: Uma2 family endonuclease [Chloroflexota bacterium]
MQQPQPESHAFTVDDYHAMVGSGILREDARVELIDGEVMDMTPIGRRHAAVVARLARMLTRRLDETVAVVWPQNPVRMDEHSEPQPDVTILCAREDDYADEEPGPDDVLLIVEVADTTLLYDRNRKVPLYARAGIAEVWLVDLTGNSITVHRDPGPQGYRDVTILRGGDVLSPRTVPGLTLIVDEVLHGEHRAQQHRGYQYDPNA